MGNAIGPDVRDPEIEELIDKVGKRLSNIFDIVEYDFNTSNDAFYISSLFFVNLTVKTDENGGTRIVRIVVKRPSPLIHLRIMVNSDVQFHNEVLFYKSFGKGQKDIPICYYAEDDPPVKSVIVLENIEEHGFELFPARYNVPVDYTKAAIHEIARFHAKSYVMRERQPDEFFKFVNDIRDPRYVPSPENTIRPVVDACVGRTAVYLRKHHKDKDFCGKVESCFEDAFENIMLKCLVVSEPIATLCHGDFTMNNTFFKKENGAIRAKLIDFAMTRYGPPAMDLSTFICLHCTDTIDCNLIDELLRVYHDSLHQSLKENDMEDRERFSYEAVRDDFKKNGLFGFIISSFFLPMLMGKRDKSLEDIAEMDLSVAAAEMAEDGGEELTEIFVKLFLVLREYGCVDHLL